MDDYSKLVSMKVYNLGCIGPEGLEVQLDDILCLVGPNNAGKSTILRAYELAVKGEALKEGDRSLRCPEGDCPRVEISVHIPDGVPNVGPDWKQPVANHLLVRSEWAWRSIGSAPVRRTFNPKIGEWDADNNASGLDTVFSARLPKPLRVAALQSPEKEQGKLLSLVLGDMIGKLTADCKTDTPLGKVLSQLAIEANNSIAEFKDDLKQAASKVNEQFQQIFPALSVAINVEVEDTPINLDAIVKKGSSIDVLEAGSKVRWDQQGTGAQRALFWSLLSVRSNLEAIKAAKVAETKASKTTKPAKNAKKKPAEDETASLDVDIKLPGHMLLIDEPETALHPNAIRAARQYLYELARDEGWQVMLTTHSPLFIDPTEDHTTIVRLERSGNELVPKTYRSDSPDFTADDKDKLKLLLRFDFGLAEMFFGGFPLVVEGDTEFAAFEEIMEINAEDYPLETRPLVIRARGKHAIVPIVKIFRQFKVPFAILHDADTPKTNAGKSNPAWSANESIRAQIFAAFAEGGEHPRITYRTSVPNFEEAHGIEPVEKDKPWNAVSTIRRDPNVAKSIRAVLDDLCNPTGDKSVGPNEAIGERVRAWGATNAKGDSRFVFPTPG